MTFRRTTLLAMTLAASTGVVGSPACAATGSAAGATQTIRIETPGADGARCEARNDLGRWIVESTPGSVTVLVSPSPLDVTCAAQGAGSPLGPTRVPSAKGEPASSVAVAGAIAGGAAAVALDSGAVGLSVEQLSDTNADAQLQELRAVHRAAYVVMVQAAEDLRRRIEAERLRERVL